MEGPPNPLARATLSRTKLKQSALRFPRPRPYPEPVALPREGSGAPPGLPEATGAEVEEDEPFQLGQQSRQPTSCSATRSRAPATPRRSRAHVDRGSRTALLPPRPASCPAPPTARPAPAPPRLAYRQARPCPPPGRRTRPEPKAGKVSRQGSPGLQAHGTTSLGRDASRSVCATIRAQLYRLSRILEPRKGQEVRSLRTG